MCFYIDFPSVGFVLIIFIVLFISLYIEKGTRSILEVDRG